MKTSALVVDSAIDGGKICKCEVTVEDGLLCVNLWDFIIQINVNEIKKVLKENDS